MYICVLPLYKITLQLSTAYPQSYPQYFLVQNLSLKIVVDFVYSVNYCARVLMHIIRFLTYEVSMTTTFLDHSDPRFDTDLIDRIRQQEANAQAALDRAKESVRHLSASVLRLRERRFQLIELDA